MDPLPIEQAFDPARALAAGFDAFKRSWPALFLGGCLMNCTEGGGGGGNSLGQLAEDRGGGGGFGRDFGHSWDLGDLAHRLHAGLADLHAAAGHALGGLSGPPLGAGMTDGVALVVGLAALAVVLLVVGGVVAFRAWIWGGYLRVQQRALGELPGEPAAEFGVLFGGADRFVDNLLWMLLSGLISFGTLAVAALPGGAVAVAGGVLESEALMWIGAGLGVIVALPAMIYVSLGLALGRCFVVFDGLPARAALDRSWAMARGQRLRLFLFFLVLGLFRFVAAVVGFLMCCVGIVVTGPAARAVSDTGLTAAFLLATRGPEAVPGARGK